MIFVSPSLSVKVSTQNLRQNAVLKSMISLPTQVLFSTLGLIPIQAVGLLVIDSKDLFDKLFIDGIHLVTNLRKYMKKKALEFMDKVYLRKRDVIESVNDLLKNTCQIEYSRHRSFGNFIGNLIAGLTSYAFLDAKPSIKIQQFLPNIALA